MTEHQNPSTKNLEPTATTVETEADAPKEAAAITLPAPEPAPGAAAQKAAETNRDLREAKQKGFSRTLDSLSAEVVTLEALKNPGGQLNFDRVQEMASVIPVNVLYQIEDLRPGSLLELFTEKTGDKSCIFNFTDKKGQINPQAEKLIGLNYFFKHQPEIRRLKVTSVDGKQEIGDRGESLKGNFYDGDEYVEVMAGYTAEILETYEKNSHKMDQLERKREKAAKSYDTVQAEPERFSGFATMLENGKYDRIDTSHVEGPTQKDRLTREIIERSADAGVDPYLVMSLLMAENGDNGRHFGVLMEGTENFEAQLDWALKIVVQNEQAFKQSGGKVEKNGHYSEEFLAYFSENYAPRTENPHHFDNLYQNYALFANFKPASPGDLAAARTEAQKKSPPRQIDASPNNGKYSAEIVIPDEAYRQELLTHLARFSDGERVAEAGRILADKHHPLYKKGQWNTGKHCWDWVNKVYTLAGFHWYQRGQTIQHYNYPHADKQLGEYARREDLYKLKPGDWLYLNVSSVNKNWGAKHGDHSVIFLGWKNKQNLVAEFAGNPKANGHATIDTRRLAGDDKVGRDGLHSYYPVVYRTSPGQTAD